jgi:exosortase/archaeosortase family protein
LQQEVGSAAGPRGSANAFPVLLAAACAFLLVLPFVTTFNDFLTTLVIKAGLQGPVQVVAEAEARLVVSLLALVGVKAGVASGGYLVLWPGTANALTMFISWNCIGWQSLVLLGISLLTGLRGNYTWAARIQVALIGTLGTISLNLLRVAVVCLLAATVGYLPAILFHDYGGTLLIVAWLFAFWALADRWILGDPIPVPERAV